MHPDLSPHLHLPECVKLIEALKSCHETHKFGRFLGYCNQANEEMLRCLRMERDQRRKENLDKAREKQQQIKERQQAKKKGGGDE